MGSGFVPSDDWSVRLGMLASVLAETDAYADFVGVEVAALGAAGMYYHGLDRRELEDAEEDFPEAMVIWQLGEDFGFRSLQAGGAPFHARGSAEMIVEATTPAEFARNTPAAKNWLMGQVVAMVEEMKLLFGRVNTETGVQRVEVSAVDLLAGPYRESEWATEDEEGVSYDYVGVAIRFEFRN